ncbi:hypothetical protein ACOMHN_063737 [Nucella lapillus]
MGRSSLCVVFLFLLVSVFVSVYAIESYTDYESAELGHIRQSNGTVVWGQLPAINSSGSKADAKSDGWDTTVKFALAVVDSVQTQAFPYDLLRRIIRNEYSESEVVVYQTNVIVVSAIGCAIGLAIVMVIVIYLIRRCRRGGKDEFLVLVSQLVARYHIPILTIGAALLLIDFIFVLCSLIVSTNAFMGALDLETAIGNSMDDVISYFSAMQQHYNFIATNTSKWFIEEVLISDLNEVGRLIWETGRDEFMPVINSTLQLVADLDSKAWQSVTYLNTLYQDMQSSMDSVVSGVDSVLTQVHFNLTTAITDFSCVGCDGSCSGCSAIVPDDIFLNADFYTLPNISTNIDSLMSLLSTNTSGTSQDPSYFFLYDIGETLTKDGNVTAAKDELIQGLLGWQNAWGNATNNILYPNETTFWFDSMKPKWLEFYDDLKTHEIVRYTFTVILCVCTVAVMAVTVASVVLAAKRGMLDIEKTGDEDFVKPKKMLGWSLVCQLVLAACLMVLSVAGFYAGANLEKAVCQPGRSLGAAEKVIDYADAMPGHPGVYLSDVLLGNGTIASIKMADALTSCGNGSTAFTVFLHHLIVPNIQQDLQNYTKHFGNMTEVFDRMRVSLPSDTTLVPSNFVSWVGNFSLFNDFNYTLFDTMLKGSVINADVDTFTANLQVIYDSGLPFEPSKSVANQTVNQLLTLEPAVINMSGPAISRGVDQYYSEFIAMLDDAANTSWQWVGEAAPCELLKDAYDASLTRFCDQYSDYVNASWLLVGHTCFFLLTVSVVSFILYRAMPDPKDIT